MTTLLLVDDEMSVLTALRRNLRQHFGTDIQVEICNDPAAGLQRALERRFDVVVCDLRMPGIDGMAFLTRFAEVQPQCVKLMLTGSADFSTAQRAVNQIGIFRYLTKPWQDTELAEHMQAAMDHAREAALQREQASAWAASQGTISPQELERRRLERLEPGLTQVDWGADGAVIMPPLN
ncbi:MAG: response regulator [Vitreoscilla sp.]|nr:response regulator [Vitreoscilla sp.]MBP6676914.1 response regulator [Vitreoscilla sp.]